MIDEIEIKLENDVLLDTNEKIKIEYEEIDFQKGNENLYLECSTEGNNQDQNFIQVMGTPTTVYSCTMCDFASKFSPLLLLHMRIHERKGIIEKYKCGFCEFETQTQYNLKSHIALCHNPEILKCNTYDYKSEDTSIKEYKKFHKTIEKLKCNICEYTGNRTSMKRHELVHKSIEECEMFKCTQCIFQTKWKHLLKNHMKIHDPLKILLKCELCTFQTLNKPVLERHLLKVHTMKYRMPEKVKCNFCEYTSGNKAHMKRHEIVHKAIEECQVFKCTQCKYQTKYKNNLSNHIKIHDPRQLLKCNICSFKTIVKAKLESHLKIHKDSSDIKMWKCDMCEFVTKHRGSLRSHKVIHKSIEDIEIFKCLICPYQTIHKRNLTTHKKLHLNSNESRFRKNYKRSLNHTINIYDTSSRSCACNFLAFCKIHKPYYYKPRIKNEIYRCYNCTFETKWKTRLRQHMISHTLTDIMKCHLCDYTTKRKTTLYAHMIVHDTSQMYQCYNCDYQTANKGNLVTHMQVHSKQLLRCHSCEFQTKQSNNLRRHIKVFHENWKEVWLCEICGIQTKYKSTLKIHLFTHKKDDEIRMFQCYHCEYQNRDKRHLARHIVKNHR